MFRYGVFMAHLLYTCEEISITMPNDADWGATCQSRIANHAQYLCDQLPDEDLASYDGRVQSMVKSVRAAASEKVPECQKWKMSK
jgi:hypothetical protein